MSFWKTSNYSYQAFAEQPKEIIPSIIAKLSREDIIEWLMWNDPNGIYDDHQSLKELGIIMQKSEGVEIMLRQIEENKPM